MKFQVIVYAIIILISSLNAQNKISPVQTLLPQQNERRDQQQFRTAQSYINHNRYTAAIPILEDLVIRNPQNNTYYDWLLRSYLMISDLNKADSLVSYMLTREPDDPRFQIGKADILYRQGMEKEARQMWEKILHQNATNLNIYAQVANTLIENRLWDDAVKIYLQAIETIPNAAHFYMNIANLYKSRLMYMEATDYYLKYLSVQPQQQGFIFNQILAFQIPEEQQKEFLQILEKRAEEPDQAVEIKLLLAQLYQRYRRYGDALTIYIQLEQVKGDDLRMLQFAQAAERDSVYEVALKAYQFIIRQNPASKQNFLAYQGVVSCRFQLARQNNEPRYAEKAIELIDTMSTRFPNQPELYRLRYLQGMFQLTYYFDIDGALSIFSKIMTSKNVPADLSNLVTIESGECFLLKGQLKEAMHRFQQVNHPSYQGYALLWQAQTSYYMKNWEMSKQLVQELINSQGTNSAVANDALSLQMRLNYSQQHEVILSKLSEADLLVFQQKKSEALKISLELVEMTTIPAPLKSRIYQDICQLSLDLENFVTALEYSKIALEDPAISAYADQPLFLMGTILENYFQKYQEAFFAYRDLLDKYPHSIHAEDCRLRMRQLREKEGWELP
ncbi:MAG: tetratricopeptide repeat protein [bacterium]|nr:MAG: tetratricopeptide repeat protein [bacterium]